MQQDGAISASLSGVQAALAAALHLPGNQGVEVRPLRIQRLSRPEALAVFMHGLADEEAVRTWLLEPLASGAKSLADAVPVPPEESIRCLLDLLPAPRLHLARDLNAAINDILSGATALFVDGCTQAIVVETTVRPAARADTQPERFSEELAANVVQLRRRLRDPGLIAQRLNLPHGRGEAALAYMRGRATPDLLHQVRQWAYECLGEEAMHRGKPGGKLGRLGFLPQVLTCPFPDSVATLVDSGYVAVLVDRAPHAYVAPVTLAAMVYNVGDERSRRPFALFLRTVRGLMAGLIVFLPGLAVALLEYHQEMIPTPMLLALSAVRDNMALPFVGEMLAVELVQEVTREASLRMAPQVTLGHSLIASTVFVTLLTFTGYLGPTSAATSLLVAFATLALPSYDMVFLARDWRWYVVLGAFAFGLFGIGAVAFALAAYMCRATSFGVPFVGETGLQFTTPGRVSSRPAGGKLRATIRAHR